MQIKPSKTIIGKSPAPTVAYFSSRGPSTIAPDILKVCCDYLQILECIPFPLGSNLYITMLKGMRMQMNHIRGET